ncbi:FolC bifunctional protein [Cylindrobasidium torrendii FP15055 ss-10]|uniref:Folylpolyglutamate synthase n=1 Tax=Cylindrobasidium torrendii FP15055 ss-10 TaxID=1314674 RepID=A0A0D7BWY0_9AGAR|nr:FolC bifunctional protein [Cylindrobasidium torrendii FP15055 ss-10]
MSTRTYRDAVDCLNTLQSNASALAAGKRLSDVAIPEMLAYLERTGYKPEDLNRLNVLHITGTKGKGSTSAFTSSILTKIRPDWKVGLYTSPHLVAVRERIRVNGKPLSEEQFTKYFFELWDRLEHNPRRKEDCMPDKPGYFRFITLLAFHAFLDLKVDATVLEVGVGGAYDSTNIVPKPRVTGITALGIDHVTVLGKTLSDIAWQKSGIFKKGVPALSVDQPEEGMVVLEKRAEELGASRFTVTPLLSGLRDTKLGLAGEHQIQNANLAVHLAQTFLDSHATVELTPIIAAGLAETKWPGRCQTVVEPTSSKLTWYLDGAHTVESLDCCMQWHATPAAGLALSSTRAEHRRVLVFNCTMGRSGPSFLKTMLTRTESQLKLVGSEENADTYFDDVIFCTNVTYADGAFKGDLTAVAIPQSELTELTVQHQLEQAWKELVPSFPSESIHVVPSIEHAVNIVRRISESAPSTGVLVCGSLHLVGGVIEVAGLADVAL